MWIRKSVEELDREERLRELKRRRFVPPAGWAVLLSLFSASSIVLGGAGWSSYNDVPMPKGDAPVAIPIIAIIVFPFWFVLFVYGRRSGRFVYRFPQARICGQCRHVDHTESPVCDKCGDLTEPLSNWKWVADQKSHPP